jgi:hypothetical protein
MTQPRPEEFFLISIKGIRYTTYFRDLTLSDGTVWSASTDVSGVSPPRVESVADREMFQITLSDPDFSLGTSFDTDYIGAPVIVNKSYVDNTVTPPVPETTVANLFVYYIGVIESVAYEVNTERYGSVTGLLNCSSPMADLDAVRAFYTTRDFMEKIAPGDTCFNQIYQGAGAVNLNWGKA